MVLDALKHIIRHGKQHLENRSPPRSTESNTSSAAQSSRARERERDFQSRSIAAAAAPTVDHQHAYANQQTQQQQQQYVPVATQALPTPDYRDAAEKIVEQENKLRTKMPVYEGLERYRLIEKMGDGAFSNVYKAMEIATGQKVAVKVVRKFELNASQDGNKHLNPQFKKRPRVTERANILKEVQIMRGIDHPSIVKLLDFFESTEHYFLILELMEGGELFHQIVKLTYFSEALARHVILQVAEGVRYLHEERGVVHRDIKPENLLFDRISLVPSDEPIRREYDEDKIDEGKYIPGVGGGEIGRVKIADFGLSKIVWDNQTMTPCGTVGYTAPEIVKDERYSKSVDMWALGCVLYTLLCGFPPFYDESINVLTEKVARGYYTFLSPWWDDISKESKDLISHLLCVDPAQRYSIDQFLNHKWVREGPTATAPRSAPLTAPTAGARAIDSPLLQSIRGGGRGEARSPAPMKDAIDAIYGIYLEKHGQGRGEALSNLNESDEDAEMDQQPVTGVQSQTGMTEQRQRYANEQEALDAGRAGIRDQPRHQKARKPFELDLDNATLMRRRHRRLGQSPLAQDSAMNNGFVFEQYTTPGSPMQVG